MNARGKSQTSRTRIWYAIAASSGAGTAYNLAQAIQPSSSAEYASYAALYDEIFVHGGAFHFTTYKSAAGTATDACRGVLAYDPADNTASGSVVAVLPVRQHYGPFLVGQTGTTAAGAPSSFTGTGFHRFGFACPKGPQLNKNLAVVQTGNWAATADTTATFGYMHVYMTAAGGTGVNVLDGFMELDVTFRVRS